MGICQSAVAPSTKWRVGACKFVLVLARFSPSHTNPSMNPFQKPGRERRGGNCKTEMPGSIRLQGICGCQQVFHTSPQGEVCMQCFACFLFLFFFSLPPQLEALFPRQGIFPFFHVRPETTRWRDAWDAWELIRGYLYGEKGLVPKEQKNRKSSPGPEELGERAAVIVGTCQSAVAPSTEGGGLLVWARVFPSHTNPSMNPFQKSGRERRGGNCKMPQVPGSIRLQGICGCSKGLHTSPHIFGIWRMRYVFLFLFFFSAAATFEPVFFSKAPPFLPCEARNPQNGDAMGASVCKAFAGAQRFSHLSKEQCFAFFDGMPCLAH